LSTIQNLKEALNRPPRVKGDGTGFDWRELDRWLQKVYQLLGTFKDQEDAINLFTGHLDNQTLLNMTEANASSVSTMTGATVIVIDDTVLLGMAPNQQTISTKDVHDDILTLYWAGV
jgi:hypothetical protein